MTTTPPTGWTTAAVPLVPAFPAASASRARIRTVAAAGRGLYPENRAWPPTSWVVAYAVSVQVVTGSVSVKSPSLFRSTSR